MVCKIEDENDKMITREVKGIYNKINYTDILTLYEKEVITRSLRRDGKQVIAAKILTNLCREISEYSPPPITSYKPGLNSYIPSIIKNKICNFLYEMISREPKKKHDSPKGVYLYGEVGCGKTMMMDLFYNNIMIDRKRRVHFHEFMQDFHIQIHKLRKEYGSSYDCISRVCVDLLNTSWLVCFDELQVTDIANAMILRSIFEGILDRNGIMVITSNRHPKDLYLNGIQRESFIPTIDLILDRFIIHEMGEQIDYRRKKSNDRTPIVKTYYFPNDKKAEHYISKVFKIITNNEEVKEIILLTRGRKLLMKGWNRVCLTTFKDLCINPLGPDDYLEICRNFDIIFVLNIPIMDYTLINEARRFITFIDTVYESKIKLFITAETHIDGLFHEVQSSNDKFISEENFSSKRTLSRLLEMQTTEWLGNDITKKIMKQS